MSVGIGQAYLMAIWSPYRFLYIASRMQINGNFLGQLSFKQRSWAGAELRRRFLSWFCESLCILSIRPLEANFASLACGNYQTRSRDWGFLNNLAGVQLMRTSSSWGNCGWSPTEFFSLPTFCWEAAAELVQVRVSGGREAGLTSLSASYICSVGMLGQVLGLTLLLLIKGHQVQGKEAQPGRGGPAWTRCCGLQGNQDVSLWIVQLTGHLDLWLRAAPCSSGQVGSDSKG